MNLPSMALKIWVTCDVETPYTCRLTQTGETGGSGDVGAAPGEHSHMWHIFHIHVHIHKDTNYNTYIGKWGGNKYRGPAVTDGEKKPEIILACN